LCVKVARSRYGVLAQVVCAAEYSDVTSGGVARVGAAPPVHAWHTGRGPGWRFGKGGPRRMDQRTKADLSVQAQQGRSAADA
jgi:hypothetical protein